MLPNKEIIVDLHNTVNKWQNHCSMSVQIILFVHYAQEHTVSLSCVDFTNTLFTFLTDSADGGLAI